MLPLHFMDTLGIWSNSCCWNWSVLSEPKTKRGKKKTRFLFVISNARNWCAIGRELLFLEFLGPWFILIDLFSLICVDTGNCTMPVFSGHLNYFIL